MILFKQHDGAANIACAYFSVSNADFGGPGPEAALPSDIASARSGENAMASAPLCRSATAEGSHRQIQIPPELQTGIRERFLEEFDVQMPTGRPRSMGSSLGYSLSNASKSSSSKEEHVGDCLRLLGTCHDLYQQSSDRNRRR